MKRLSILVLIFGAILFAGCNSAKRAAKQGEKRFINGEYEFAIERYTAALQKGTKKPDVANFKIAEAYRLSNRIKMAEPFYAKALELGTLEENAHFYQIFALKANGKYPEAKDQIMKYGPNKNFKNTMYKSWAKDELDNLAELDSIIAKQNYYQLTNVDFINTPGAEYGPISYEGDQLVFTSARAQGPIYAANGQGFTDLYKIKFDDETRKSGSVTMFLEKYNIPNVHEGAITISPDGKMIVFARGNDGSKKGATEVNLFYSVFSKGDWTEPQMLPISDQRAWDSSPAFSNDGKSLYFASNREGGRGGIDLWRATVDKNGRFKSPKNMGKVINTKGDEMFPYVSDDGKLYFSSDGHPGLGGLDLFAATSKGGEVKIENLGVPMNSTSDDFGIVFINEFSGYVSSNREGGKGDDDIYFFENKIPNRKTATYSVKATTVRGDNEEILSGVNIKVADNNNKMVAEVVTGEDGEFTFPVEIGKNYVITAEKEKFFTKRDLYTTAGKAKAQEDLPEMVNKIVLDYVVALDEIVENKAIVLDNIYYDLNKSDIREDAALELDKLVTLLQDNPGISIELSSHTDNRGDDKYNQILSQKRAEAAVAYLITNGIDQARVTAKGYGETRPIMENAEAEEDHQKNRRTEFKVTEYKK